MKKSTLALIFLALAANTSAWLAFRSRPGISAENGPMENYQLICLFLSFVVWLISAMRSGNKPEKVLLTALALFSLSFFILEIDTRKFDMPIINKYFRGKYRNGALILLWLGLGFAFFRNRAASWRRFLGWLRTASAVCMIASGGLWILSGLNDKHVLGRKSLYFEEMMEVNATLLMLLAAILVFRTLENLKRARARTTTQTH